MCFLRNDRSVSVFSRSHMSANEKRGHAPQMGKREAHVTAENENMGAERHGWVRGTRRLMSHSMHSMQMCVDDERHTRLQGTGTRCHLPSLALALAARRWERCVCPKSYAAGTCDDPRQGRMSYQTECVGNEASIQRLRVLKRCQPGVESERAIDWTRARCSRERDRVYEKCDLPRGTCQMPPLCTVNSFSCTLTSTVPDCTLNTICILREFFVRFI
jgi:hypothetical protein